VVVQAADLAAAQELAQEALQARSQDESRWSLGVLKPLTPMAPGTHRYRVTFAVWEAEADRFVRHDVHVIEVWAADGASARRMAQQEVQSVAAYRPAWRIRAVAKVGGRARRGEGPRT
jgi:hypothetical protein